METSPIKVPVGPPTKNEENSEEFFDLSARFGDGNIAKMVMDYTKQVDIAIPKAEALANVKSFFLLLKYVIFIIFRRGKFPSLLILFILWKNNLA